MKSRTPLLLPSPLWRLVLLLLLWTNVRDYNSPSLYLSLSKFIGKFVGKMLENVNSIRNISYTSSSFNRATNRRETLQEEIFSPLWSIWNDRQRGSNREIFHFQHGRILIFYGRGMDVGPLVNCEQRGRDFSYCGRWFTGASPISLAKQCSSRLLLDDGR